MVNHCERAARGHKLPGGVVHEVSREAVAHPSDVRTSVPDAVCIEQVVMSTFKGSAEWKSVSGACAIPSAPWLMLYKFI